MPAHRVVGEAQERALLDAMHENLDIARGRVSSQGGPLAKQNVNLFWERLASRLNAMGSGAIKDGKKWREYWADRKCQVRKKASALRQHAGGTGGGPAKKGRLTDVEEEILQIIGTVNAFGEPSVRIPFNEPSPVVPPSPAEVQLPAAASQPQDAAQQQHLVVPAPADVQPPAAGPQPQNAEQQQLVVPAPAVVQQPAAGSQPPNAVQHQLEPPPFNNARPPARPTNRQAMEERLSISAPQWALDFERQRLETERERATASTRTAAAIERLAQAAEAQTGMLRLLLEELRAQRGAQH